MKKTTSPTGLPVLSEGKHRDPAEGACVMEYTSVLAGERFSDHPRCTHPALAQFARLVNDSMDAAYRHRLALLAPGLAGTAGRDRRLVATIQLHCALAGLAVQPNDSALRRLARRADAEMQHAGRARRWITWVADNPGATRVSHAYVAASRSLVSLSAADRNEHLYQLLAGAIDACRAMQSGATGEEGLRPKTVHCTDSGGAALGPGTA